MRFQQPRFRQIWLLVLVFSVISGCASLKDKFVSSREANVGFFADQTIAILGNTQFALDPQRTIYIRNFFDLEGAEEKRYIELTNNAEDIMLGIVRYSLAIVTITETERSEAGRVKAYTEFLKAVQNNAEDKLDLQAGHYDHVVEKVGKQEDFLGALRQAQPIVNAVGRYSQLLMDRINSAAKVLEQKLDRRVDEEYADVILYQKSIDRERYNLLQALLEIDDAYLYGEQTLERIARSGAVKNPRLIPGGEPTDEQLENLSDHLLGRLDNLGRIWKEIEPDWELYRKTHRELDGQYVQLLEDTTQFRMTMIVWLRAHQKMAAGVVNPAQWFDIENAPSEILKLGSQAIP